MNRTAFILLYLTILSIPMENMVAFTGFGTISKLFGASTFIFYLLAVISKGQYRSIVVFHYLIVVLTVWGTTSFYWSVDKDASILAIKTMAQIMILVVIIWELTYDKIRQVKIIQAYIIGCMVPTISIIINYKNMIEDEMSRVSAYGYDPNDISLTITLSVPFAMNEIIRTSNKTYRLFLSIYILLSSAAIILTASRGGFLAFLVVLLYAIYMIFTKMKKINKLCLAAWIASFVGTVSIIPEFYWLRIFSTFKEISSGSLGYRSVIWMNGFRAFVEEPLAGYGIGTFRYVIGDFLGTSMSPHNMFLSIMVGQGVVGLLIFLAIIYFVVFSIKDIEINDKGMWLAVLMSFLIGSIGLNWGYNKITYLVFILIVNQRYISFAGRDTKKTNEYEYCEQ